MGHGVEIPCSGQSLMGDESNVKLRASISLLILVLVMKPSVGLLITNRLCYSCWYLGTRWDACQLRSSTLPSPCPNDESIARWTHKGHACTMDGVSTEVMCAVSREISL